MSDELQQQWVPVEQRLPDRGQPVLVCYECGVRIAEIGWLPVGDDDYWRVPGVGTYKTRLVTHWMHLPELPS
jgi:hypothetical protein